MDFVDVEIFLITFPNPSVIENECYNSSGVVFHVRFLLSVSFVKRMVTKKFYLLSQNGESRVRMFLVGGAVRDMPQTVWSDLILQRMQPPKKR